MNIFMGRQQPMQAQRTGGPMQPGMPQQQQPGLFGGILPMQPQQQAQPPGMDLASFRSNFQSMLRGEGGQLQPSAPVSQSPQIDPRSTIASLLMKGGR